MTIEHTPPIAPVTGIQPHSTGDKVASDVNTPRHQRTPAKNTPSDSASVTLSDAQALLLQPHEGDVDKARVEQLKAAIRNGELVMDTSKIADALISQVQELVRGE